MATAAILAHLGDLNLEAVEILGGVHGGLGIAGKLGEPGGEIGPVFPNRRQCRGIPAGLGIVREERRRFFARLGEGRGHLFRCGEIEGLLGLQHVGGDLALIAVGLHQRLAGGDRVALCHQRGGAEPEHCNDERGADHLSCSLCGLISAPGGAASADGHRVNIAMDFFIPHGTNTANRARCWICGSCQLAAVRTAASNPENPLESLVYWRPSRFRERQRAERVTAYAPACPPQSPPTGAPRSPACPRGGYGKPARARRRRRSSPPGKTRWRPPPPPPSPPAEWCGPGH